jgi:hypothetical protein
MEKERILTAFTRKLKISHLAQGCTITPMLLLYLSFSILLLLLCRKKMERLIFCKKLIIKRRVAYGHINIVPITTYRLKHLKNILAWHRFYYFDMAAQVIFFY